MTVGRVAVVGAGAVGATTARDLADHGLDVTLFERDRIDWDGDRARRTPSEAASARAAGVVYDAYAEDIDAALAARAVERFRAFDGARGFQFHDCPYAILVHEGDDERIEATRRAAARMREHGRAVETLAPAAFGDRFPSVAVDDLAVAAVAADAGWTDTRRYVAAALGAARAADVTVRDATPVTLETATRLSLPDGTVSFDAVVVAAGAHTPQLAAGVGVDLAAVPYRVQALTVGTDDSPHGGPMWYDATEGVYARPHPDGLLVGDGTVPEATAPDGWDRTADDWFRADALAVARERTTGLDVPTDAWAGVCTATPDGDPLLGRADEGLYVATGWQGHGFMRAPAHAELLAARVAADLGADADPTTVPGGATALAAFDPARFPAGTEFEVREGMLVEER
ncbi:NAD(P)/FAD-dependent oxidoreductase [Halobaculum sp. MBLA0143]|uniref:NAD(P)/FAD-dependent oxidoreductase n=1 Tax=Halobaculum sp. MBLA0143 TaxID=3079933 RepID=UPI00352684F6